MIQKQNNDRYEELYMVIMPSGRNPNCGKCETDQFALSGSCRRQQIIDDRNVSIMVTIEEIHISLEYENGHIYDCTRLI